MTGSEGAVEGRGDVVLVNLQRWRHRTAASAVFSPYSLLWLDRVCQVLTSKCDVWVSQTSPAQCPGFPAVLLYKRARGVR